MTEGDFISGSCTLPQGNLTVWQSVKQTIVIYLVRQYRVMAQSLWTYGFTFLCKDLGIQKYLHTGIILWQQRSCSLLNTTRSTTDVQKLLKLTGISITRNWYVTHVHAFCEVRTSLGLCPLPRTGQQNNLCYFMQANDTTYHCPTWWGS